MCHRERWMTSSFFRTCNHKASETDREKPTQVSKETANPHTRKVLCILLYTPTYSSRGRPAVADLGLCISSQDAEHV